MPVVFRDRDFRFFFYSNEGDPREPAHIHVRKGKEGLEAKFWLRPEVRVAYNDGYDARTLRELMGIVELNRELIERTWNEFFS